MPDWIDLGPVASLKEPARRIVDVGGQKVVLTLHDGRFGAVSDVCNHVGGHLGEGTLEGEYLTCPWHYWKFHFATGEGEPGFEKDCVPSYALKEENGRLFVCAQPVTKRNKLPHEPHPLSRKIERAEGPIRVVGISTTAMTRKFPRYSTSEALLEHSLKSAAETGCETKLIKLNELKFKNCEGFYSKSANACTWPCSITHSRALRLPKRYSKQRSGMPSSMTHSLTVSDFLSLASRIFSTCQSSRFLAPSLSFQSAARGRAFRSRGAAWRASRRRLRKP